MSSCTNFPRFGEFSGNQNGNWEEFGYKICSCEIALVLEHGRRLLHVDSNVLHPVSCSRPYLISVRAPPDWVMELPEIRRAIHHLVRDSNRDVRHFVSFLPPILGHDLSQEDKVKTFQHY